MRFGSLGVLLILHMKLRTPSETYSHPWPGFPHWNVIAVIGQVGTSLACWYIRRTTVDAVADDLTMTVTSTAVWTTLHWV